MPEYITKNEPVDQKPYIVYTDDKRIVYAGDPDADIPGGGSGDFVTGTFVSCSANVGGDAVEFFVGVGTQPVAYDKFNDSATISENATILVAMNPDAEVATIECHFVNFNDPNDKISVDTETGTVELSIMEGLPPAKYAYAKVKKPADPDAYGFVMDVTTA